MIFPYRMPALVRKLYPGLIYNCSPADRSVYLTFDDGPSPEATPFVLEQLAKYNAQATFFLIGDKLDKYKTLVKRIHNEGHGTGNHTFHHLNARKNPPSVYLADTEKTQAKLETIVPGQPKMFRPPYGKITRKHLRLLRKKNYAVVMWSLLSFDYDPKVDPYKSLEKLKQKIRPGDIVVFHDSRKAFPSLKIILPEFLEFLTAQGFKPKNIRPENKPVSFKNR